jgi:hypothetical protein
VGGLPAHIGPARAAVQDIHRELGRVAPKHWCQFGLKNHGPHYVKMVRCGVPLFRWTLAWRLHSLGNDSVLLAKHVDRFVLASIISPKHVYLARIAKRLETLERLRPSSSQQKCYSSWSGDQ